MTTLTQVCLLIVDCEHKTAPTQDSGVPSIRTPNVGRGRLLLDGVNRVSEETYAEWAKRVEPRSGDLILAREAPVGNVALIPPGLRVCLGQRTVLIRPDLSSVDASYLLYLLLGPEIQGKFSSIASGATVPHLNLGDIRALNLLRLPPLAVQQRIGSALSAYDDLIDNNSRRIAILEEMTRVIYRDWLVEFRFPGHEKTRMASAKGKQFPEGWTVLPLGKIVHELRDTVDPKVIDAATPYIGLEHLPRRSTTLSEWGFSGDVESTKLRFCAGDILFGKIRPYFHKVAVAPFDGVSSSDAIVMRLIDSDLHGLVLGCVSSDEFVAHATQTSNGTKMPRANWSILKEYPVPMPPAPILASFDGLVRGAIAEAQVLAAKNRNLRTTRDLLLPKLISGEIDVSAIAETDAVTATP